MEQVLPNPGRPDEEQSVVLSELGGWPVRSGPYRVLALPAVLVVLFIALTGCRKKPDVQQSVSELEKAFPAAALASPSTQPQNPVPGPTPVSDPNADISRALAAVRNHDYAGGIIALQEVPNKPGMSAQQLMAVERAKQALTANLVARAAAGDSQAKAALAAIEKTRSQ